MSHNYTETLKLVSDYLDPTYIHRQLSVKPHLTSPPRFSRSDLCKSAPSGLAGATPRGPTEAAGAATEAAGRTGGAGAEDEGAADGQRG